MSNDDGFWEFRNALDLTDQEQYDKAEELWRGPQGEFWRAAADWKERQMKERIADVALGRRESEER